MSEDYDQAYAQPDLFGAEPSPLLARHADLLPAGCRVLDLGVGQGRNALPLARAGCRVTGLDTSRRALEMTAAQAAAEGLTLDLLRQDALAWDPCGPFDAVLVFGLLQMMRPAAAASLVFRLHGWVRPGGALFLVAWHVGDPGRESLERKWRTIGRRALASPDGRSHRFYLEPGQVLDLFPGWRLVHHREGLGPVHRHGDSPEERHGDVETVLIRPAQSPE